MFAGTSPRGAGTITEMGATVKRAEQLIGRRMSWSASGVRRSHPAKGAEARFGATRPAVKAYCNCLQQKEMAPWGNLGQCRVKIPRPCQCWVSAPKLIIVPAFH